MEIEKYAEQNDVDLIVMGSHTKEKSGKWYVGSAVERVSLRSICPVIVVTDPKALLSMDDEMPEVWSENDAGIDPHKSIKDANIFL